jgi:hypothetical protein
MQRRAVDHRDTGEQPSQHLTSLTSVYLHLHIYRFVKIQSRVSVACGQHRCLGRVGARAGLYARRVSERARWEGLFADLEAQAAALAAVELDQEVAERTRIGAGELTLADRLRPTVGHPLRIRSASGVVCTGRLTRIGTEWLLLEGDSGREAIVVVEHIATASGVGRLTAPARSADAVTSRLGLGHALRGLARDRSAISVNLIDGSELHGTIDRVSAGFIEFAQHSPGEARRRREVQDVLLVAWKAMVALRRDA